MVRRSRRRSARLRRLAKDFQATIESALAGILVAQIRRLTREGLKSMTFISSQTLGPLGVTWNRAGGCEIAKPYSVYP